VSLQMLRAAVQQNQKSYKLLVYTHLSYLLN